MALKSHGDLLYFIEQHPCCAPTLARELEEFVCATQGEAAARIAAEAAEAQRRRVLKLAPRADLRVRPTLRGRRQP